MEYGLVAVWLVTYLLFLYAGGVILDAAFPRLSERGALGVGLPLALAVVWIVGFLVGQFSFLAGILLGIAALVGLVAWSSYRGGVVDTRRYLETAGVFAIAFGVVVVIRGYDPVIVPIAGEKFLDFGLLKSLLRADSLPPEDVWFAGKPEKYYYGGHLLAAILARVTGTAGRFAYNLALAGFYASLVAAVYGLAGAIAAERGVSRLVGASVGAFLVGIASNLSTPGKLLLWALPDDLARSIASTVGIPMEGLATGPARFNYWAASRVITDEASDFAFYEPALPTVINEFPFFAFLNGDLHAHMMSPPFLVLATAILLAYYWAPVDERRRRLGLLFGALPVVTAQLAVTNTWSLPTVGGLTVLTVALAPANPMTLLPAGFGGSTEPNAWRTEATRIGVGIAAAVGVLLLGLVWSAPYWPGPTGTRTISFLPDRSSLGELLVVHGAFVAVFAPYFYRHGALASGTDNVRIGLLVVVASVAVGSALDVAAVGLFLPAILAGWYLLRRTYLPVGEEDSGGKTAGYEAILVIAGAGLIILVEFVFLKEAVGRMNTVFKYYWHVWVFFSVAGGVALAWLLDGRRPPTPRLSSRGVAILSVVLVLITSVYAGFALANHVGGGPMTLDGLGYLEEEHPREAAAIYWLNDNIEGQPNIVTAAPGGYRWRPSAGKGASAPASLTGVPTVLGWFHERQYRGGDVYRKRLRAVRRIYESENARLQADLIRRYDVEYVYVGPAERAKYEVTVDDLAGVEARKEWNAVTIYRVNQSALPG